MVYFFARESLYKSADKFIRVYSHLWPYSTSSTPHILYNIVSYLDLSWSKARLGGWTPSLDEGLADESSHGLEPEELPDVLDERELVRFLGTLCASERRMLQAWNWG